MSKKILNTDYNRYTYKKVVHNLKLLYANLCYK